MSGTHPCIENIDHVPAVMQIGPINIFAGNQNVNTLVHCLNISFLSAVYDYIIRPGLSTIHLGKKYRLRGLVCAGALKESCGLDLRLLSRMDFSEKTADPVF